MFGADRGGHRPREIAFVAVALVEAQRERVHRRAVSALRQGRHRTRIDPTRQEHAERHVGFEMAGHAVVHDVAQLLLTDRRLSAG